jgi:hypothetical protein
MKIDMFDVYMLHTGGKGAQVSEDGESQGVRLQGSGEGGCDVTQYRSLPRSAELCGCVAKLCELCISEVGPVSPRACQNGMLVIWFLLLEQAAL